MFPYGNDLGGRREKVRKYSRTGMARLADYFQSSVATAKLPHSYLMRTIYDFLILSFSPLCDVVLRC